jgi:hypothetical protein
MLTLQRRHSSKCPDKKEGPNFLKCRGHCSIRICGMQDGKRVRASLKTRDLQRAARRLTQMLDDEALGRSRKTITDAIAAFHAQHKDNAPETKRKYKRVLSFLSEHCEAEHLKYVDQNKVETMDTYALWRNKTNWTWIKEVEILRQFFTFCIDREWTRKNPARALKRPRLLEANDVATTRGQATKFRNGSRISGFRSLRKTTQFRSLSERNFAGGLSVRRGPHAESVWRRSGQGRPTFAGGKRDLCDCDGVPVWHKCDSMTEELQ